MPEIIDIFDANRVAIGTKERGAAHRDGDWHQTFHCWIAGTHANSDFLLLQLRSQAKKNYPNMVDITAAGHLQSGESPEDGVRELAEEIGVEVLSSNLRYLGIKHDISDEVNGSRNREFAHVFLLRDDRPLDRYKLQEDEVAGLVELPLTQGLEMFAGLRDEVLCKTMRQDGGQKTEGQRLLRTVDLIPRVDSYYLKTCIMADLFLRGAPFLSI